MRGEVEAIDKMSRPDRLFKKYDQSHAEDTITSRLYLLAVQIEDTLLEGGAKADIDYNYQNLIEWAIKLYKK